ncbi:hypothetical protein [Lysobacter sp. F6437]|uniref:hypothetical protein n=1 Tax=Lysobacter sp. F6437 TaxID=3459296 RepID=UPI00403DA042
MKAVAIDLIQQSRTAEAAAWCLRDMSCRRPAPNDLRAVAAALERSASKLLQIAFQIENSKEPGQ